jgi:hypothetical protein
MKKLVAGLPLVLLLIPSVYADEAACTGFTDFMRQSYSISMNCQTLLGLSEFKKAHEGHQIAYYNQNTFQLDAIPGRKFSIDALDHMNGNTSICGKAEQIGRYTDKFGMPKNNDLTTAFVEKKDVPPEVILPEPPPSIQNVDGISQTWGAYINTALSIELQGKKQFNALKKARNEFWAKGFSTLANDPVCAESFCKTIGGVDPTGKPTLECKKSLKGMAPHDFYEKVALAHASPADMAKTATAVGEKAGTVEGPDRGKKVDSNVSVGTAKDSSGDH